MCSSATQLPDDLQTTVRRALAEDIGSGDITAAIISPDSTSTAKLTCHEQAILCGAAWFDEVFRQLDHRISIDWHTQDGALIHAHQVLCELQGPSQGLLTGERTALNFLQTLSGTATLAHRYADVIRGTQAKILDTRKTLPGLRMAQKYAVQCGGCHNHRMGLYDAILIKENHIRAAGSLRAAVEQARRITTQLKVEVEAENIDEVREALDVGVDAILLDNMPLPLLRRAVTLAAKRVTVEASGGVTLENLRSIAETGVDYISVGRITKDLHAIDLSIRFLSAPAKPD